MRLGPSSLLPAFLPTVRGLLAVLSLQAGACSPTSTSPDLSTLGQRDMVSAESPDLTYVPTNPLVIARPYSQAAPSDYDPAKAYPLVILLHGYRATSFIIDRLFHMSDAVDAKQFVYAYPDATKYDMGYTRWNAESDAAGPDDVAYLDAIIADMSTHYHVDPKRVFVVGHSNGAEMAYRYGCDRSDRVAAIVPVAGSYSTDPMKCAPKTPTAQLQIVGDADPGYPGNPPVRTNSVYWATLDHCSATTDTTSPMLDLDNHPGPDTSVERWPACAPNSAVEMWVIHGAGHNIDVSAAFPAALIDWLNRRARP